VIVERPSPEGLEAMRRVLRLKRFEIGAVAETLPGVVRRGAEVDLAPLQERLAEVGVRAELRRVGS